MFGWFKSKTPKLKDVIGEVKELVIRGVIFKIKKISPLDHLNGSQVMLAMFDTYKAGGKEVSDVDSKKIKQHYGDIILAGVVSPVIVRKDDGKHTSIDEVLSDWDLAEELYQAIIIHTYSKKKLKSRSLRLLNAAS